MFLINFDKTQTEIYKTDEIPDEISYHLGSTKSDKSIALTYEKTTFESYKEKFTAIQKHIENGDFYLANLTYKTKILNNISLEELYLASSAPFKIYKKDHFVCFTPERFITIKNNKISTFPMKGTSKNRDDLSSLLSNKKELAEHLMSVDLLRNDLSIVSKNVRVERFRYSEMIKNSNGEFFQTSSKISGNLEEGWQGRIGNILDALLPAGSISGTPKKIVVESLKKIEELDRGYFCGVAGVFDGEKLESFVLIRFIEQNRDGLYYRSGGGITALSDPQEEYEEIYRKIYVPVF